VKSATNVIACCIYSALLDSYRKYDIRICYIERIGKQEKKVNGRGKMIKKEEEINET